MEEVPEHGYAFPKVWTMIDKDGTDVTVTDHGLTKREYFAGLALQGLLSNQVMTQGYSGPEEKAKEAIQYADALLLELAK